jgi:beta-glucanase (GH16 family)
MRLYYWLVIIVSGILLSCHHNEEDYLLVWSDEFDYTGLPNPDKWSYDTDGNSWGWGNNELQHYTESRKENAWVENGVLKITAHKETFEDKNYTSARLITKGKGDWLYGKVEVRAKLPVGRGLWPAIWMLPTDWEYGEWPESGEIDIMEHVGYLPDSIFASAHTGKYNHIKGTHKTSGIKVNNLYNDFHLYTLEWTPEEYSVSMNGNKFFTFKNEGSGPEGWPFDKRFHLLLNLAVGGNWGGKFGVDDGIFPQTFEIDYVRVYQKK